ncbi:hypothetical protein [Ruminococcus sp. XPD3002]|uniref:hypothetical protein n=1 Tax=Ruminococcus sp. XPD3002 TaxID=1452269 RepID=UPI0009124783|nr:hypothetical protein SAMN04487832_103158 [Ruminococcus flavefaciens]
MDLLSFFRGGKYFDKNITPKCDYCQFGKRAKDGNKVLCEKKGLVDCNYSCNKFAYSPLKRIPVKQLNFVGSLADEDIYIESKGDRDEKEAAERAAKEAENKAKEKEKKAAEAQAKAKADEAAKLAAAEAEFAAKKAAAKAASAANAVNVTNGVNVTNAPAEAMETIGEAASQAAEASVDELAQAAAAAEGAFRNITPPSHENQPLQ